MSPKTENQFQEIRANRKKQIMEVALELFAENGSYSTSIAKIASRAGISKGLMYNYFENKEALIEALIYQGIEKLFQAFNFDPEKAIHDETFKASILKIVENMKDDYIHWKFYFSFIMQSHPQDVVNRIMHEMSQPQLERISEYFESKGFESPEDEVVYFESVLDGITMNYILDPEEYPLERMVSILLKRYDL